MIRNALSRFLYGRYGKDQLTTCLLFGYLFFLMLYLIFSIPVLYWIALAFIFYALFRTLSRNYEARRRENAWFCRHVYPVMRWIRLQKTIWKDKEHRYFKCPNCGQYLRVPRGKGKITIHCSNCSVGFQEES